MNVSGQRIKWKDKVKYLGNILTKDMCDGADIRAKRGEFIGSVNRLNLQFRVVPDQIRIRLLQTYCTAWYGCQTWLLNTNHVKGMNIEWKKAVRRRPTLNLPRMTRSKLIPLLAGNSSFQEQHERRCGALYASMMQSDNMLVHYMARRAMYNVLGTLGMNRVILLRPVTRGGSGGSSEPPFSRTPLPKLRTPPPRSNFPTPYLASDSKHARFWCSSSD